MYSAATDRPLNSPFLSIKQTAGNEWHVGLHQIHDRIKVGRPAAEKRLSDLILALSACSTSHLSKQCRADEIATHARAVKNDSSRGTTFVSTQLLRVIHSTRTD